MVDSIRQYTKHRICVFRFGVGNMEHAVPWGLDTRDLPCSPATEHDIITPPPMERCLSPYGPEATLATHTTRWCCPCAHALPPILLAPYPAARYPALWSVGQGPGMSALFPGRFVASVLAPGGALFRCGRGMVRAVDRHTKSIRVVVRENRKAAPLQDLGTCGPHTCATLIPSGPLSLWPNPCGTYYCTSAVEPVELNHSKPPPRVSGFN